MPHKHVEVSQTGFQGRPHEDYDHVKIHRLNESLPTDTSHYLMAALGEVHEGEPVPAQYPGPAVAYVIEGELHVEDASKPGEVIKLVAGDVIHVEYGSRNTFTCPAGICKVFGVTYAPSTHHPEDYIVKK